MNIFYLISIIIGVSAQNIIKKPYTDKTNGKGVYFFSLLTSLSAMLFFVLISRGLNFEIRILPYSLLFALSYALTTVFSVLSVACGSLSLTSLIISYSLMIPTFYGLIFLNDDISIGLFPGIALLALSLLLINKKSDDSPITLKWLIYVLLAFIGNGMCTVSQKMQQVAFDGEYKNEFMILALAVVSIILALLIIASERKEIKTYAKFGWHLSIICGIMNGAVNLFVMLLSGKMPASLMFPLISAGGIIVTYIVSRFFYKEKLTKTQLCGFILGTISVVFLNI